MMPSKSLASSSSAHRAPQQVSTAWPRPCAPHTRTLIHLEQGQAHAEANLPAFIQETIPHAGREAELEAVREHGDEPLWRRT